MDERTSGPKTAWAQIQAKMSIAPKAKDMPILANTKLNIPGKRTALKSEWAQIDLLHWNQNWMNWIGGMNEQIITRGDYQGKKWENWAGEMHILLLLKERGKYCRGEEAASTGLWTPTIGFTLVLEQRNLCLDWKSSSNCGGGMRE